jgi:hypothetical protein
MKTAKPLTFATIPAWALPETPGVEGFYAAIALAGMEDKWVRLSADTQRALLGKVVFGKREIKVDDLGEIAQLRTVCFGTMADTTYTTPTGLRNALTF